MIRKKATIGIYRLLSLITVLLIGCVTFMGANVSKLPTQKILGKEYYVYESKNGETIYGISKKLGWDENQLQELNPEAQGVLKKGTKIFYPVEVLSQVISSREKEKEDTIDSEPIIHTVKKGETVYSISRQYSISPSYIYEANPASKYGVKTGEVLTIPQNPTSKYYYHTIKNAETLTSVSVKFNISVEDILKDNPGLTLNNIKEGETLRLSRSSIGSRIKSMTVAEEQVTGIKGYKVEKDDSWQKIAAKTGVEEEVLRAANENDKNLKTNSVIIVPTIETVEVVKEIAAEEYDAQNSEELKEIYDSIHGVSPADYKTETIRIALILDDPNSKKDIDFTRGMLVGLNQFKTKPYKIDLNVIDGRMSTNNLMDNIEGYEPSLIIATADKAFPVFLADYGNTNDIQVVNVFDLKNDLYEDNASIIQLLPPSSYFAEHIGGRIYRDNREKKLIMVGSLDESDGVGNELVKNYGDIKYMNLEEFGVYRPEISEDLLIYSCSSKKEEVADFIQALENMSESLADSDYLIIGRSNWTTFIDDYGNKFKEYHVVIPSRVWLDEESEEWQTFLKNYNELFEDGQPVRSIPNFAASGYDVLNYFVNVIYENKGDFNRINPKSATPTLQSDINLKRVNNWGGLMNLNSFLLEFSPSRGIKKILVD